ncbi:MAG: glycine cleavage system aminomethyltransferase GcvT [Verrucomicrobiota bacterium JB023]|nr:glycine cleavage system aminomethyltransferase GcvT [Verrucomicrobiota bacterium JB023]
MSESKKSPLDELHRENGGRMVDFAGWSMPVMFKSILEEHKAVREEVGIFDISHMGQLFVEGEGAGEWLDRMLTNNVASLGDGEGQYTFLLNERGGVIDDLIIYRVSATSYFLVVNASCLEQDVAWLGQHLPEELTLRDESEKMAGMAVQGPKSADVFSRVLGGRTLPTRNGVDILKEDGQEILVCRTGYTGEDGFEFFCRQADAERWWREFQDAGAVPCGLGARDTLRLEKCYPLNGSDLSPERTPLEAGLGFFVDLKKDDFVGRDVLAEQKEEGLTERLAAILYDGKGSPPRPGYPVVDEEGNQVGTLTSGALSPSLGQGIALAYLPVELAKVGTPLAVEVRGRKVSAKVVKKPFVR